MARYYVFIIGYINLCPTYAIFSEFFNGFSLEWYSILWPKSVRSDSPRSCWQYVIICQSKWFYYYFVKENGFKLNDFEQNVYIHSCNVIHNVCSIFIVCM